MSDIDLVKLANDLKVLATALPNQLDFYLEIAKGNISDHSNINGYGERVNTGTTATGEDVWLGTATSIPIPPTAGEQMTLISSVNTDGAAGKTGVNTLHINYLDSNGDEQTEDITMNGNTEVDTVATDIRFVQNMHSLTVGATGVADGNIIIYQKGDNTKIYCMIAAGGNMSLVTNRMIPNGKTCYITGWHATASGKTAQDQQLSLRLRSTDHDGILYTGVFIFKDVVYIKDAAVDVRFTAYVKIPALSIVKVSAWADVAGAEISAYWEGILVDD